LIRTTLGNAHPEKSTVRVTFRSAYFRRPDNAKNKGAAPMGMGMPEKPGLIADMKKKSRFPPDEDNPLRLALPACGMRAIAP
jgi:hypothetical protein